MVMDGNEAGVLMGWTGCRTCCRELEDDTKRQIALNRIYWELRSDCIIAKRVYRSIKSKVWGLSDVSLLYNSRKRLPSAKNDLGIPFAKGKETKNINLQNLHRSDLWSICEVWGDDVGTRYLDPGRLGNL
jgi:hypothetical protein